jgi:hypothetical protein
MPAPEQSVAFHEAGHAVLCHLADVQVSRLSLMPTVRRGNKLLGQCCYFLPSQSSDWHKILICLAGPISEAIHDAGHSGVNLCHQWEEDRSSDVREALQLAESLGWGDEPHAVLDEAAETAHRILGRPAVWSAVQAVAAALLSEGV